MTVWPGRPFPLGATWDGTGTNFSLFSENAARVELCLFDAEDRETRVDLTERRFLGLARTRPDDSAHQVPEGPLHTLDPLQNLFTEVIDSLIDMHKMAADPAHQALPAPALPSLQHRGAAVWAADLILMQIGRDPLKRLADRVAPQGDTLTASLLDAYAASNRRWARVEDAVIWQWLSQFDRSGNDTRFDAN